MDPISGGNPDSLPPNQNWNGEQGKYPHQSSKQSEWDSWTSARDPFTRKKGP